MTTTAEFRTTPLVLVVDDSDFERAIAREALELDAEFVVHEARDGVLGIEQFREHRPDIVLLDVKMPRMDGFETCAAIRDIPGGEHLPVLMMTGLDDVASIERAYDAGATDFFTKPVNPTILRHRLRYLLRGQRMADALRRSEAKLASANRLARLGHWEWDIETSRVSWSSEVYAIFEAPLDTDCGVFDAMSPFLQQTDAAQLIHALEAGVRHGQSASVEHSIHLADGTTRVVQQEIEPVRAESDGRIVRLLGTAQDLTQRVEAERRIRHLAYYDPVTELPNRSLLKEQLNRTIALARRGSRSGAVVFLDLDDFKRINDTCGHEAGDTFLRQVAARLTHCVRADDFVCVDTGPEMGDAAEPREGHTIARLGGDEFVIVLCELHAPEDAVAAVTRIHEALAQPFVLAGREFHVTCSSGVSVFPDDGVDAEALLRNADMAMYHAKSLGRNCFHFFTESLNERVMHRIAFETSMHEALERGEFRLHYQPRIAVDGAQVVGAEALVRWEHPEHGLIAPDRFITVAEETGLIIPLGSWVLAAACRQGREWLDRGVPVGRLSVNLSAAQFKAPSLKAEIAATLRDTRLPPEMLELELTESVLMDDAEESAEVLSELKALGVRIAVDDFGTGYSSLAYLKRFPIDSLKIDKAFVSDVCNDPDDAVIVATTIVLGHALRLQVVAEGVEEEAQLSFLREHRCDECQGYLFSRPLPVAEFEDWVGAATAEGGSRECAPENGAGARARLVAG